MKFIQADDYPALKKAVLKRYQLTEEGFRLKFRDSKPEQGETVFQCMARLVCHFSRWAEMAEVDGTFESLVDLIIREQFIQTCSPELALFLKERMLKSRAEVTKYAEQYIEAHGGSIASRRPNQLSTEHTTNSHRGQLPAQLPNHHKLIDQADRNLFVSYAERRDTLQKTVRRMIKRR